MTNYLKKLALLAALTITPLAFGASDNTSSDASLAALANEFIDQVYFPESPTVATLMGIHLYDDKLEDLSPTAMNKEVGHLKEYEAKFSAINPEQLSVQAQGDRELILNHIHSELLSRETIQEYKKNPNIYPDVVSGAAFAIIERKFAPLPERLKYVVAREKLMPALLQEARINLDNPPLIFTQITLEQLPGIISFFQNDVPAAFKDVKDVELQKQFAVSNAAVIAALLEYQTWLKTDLLPRSNGDFRLGAEVFSKKLSYDEMVDLPLDKLLAIGQRRLRADQNEYARVARLVEPHSRPLELLAKMNNQHPAPSKLLATFRDSFDDLIKFIEQKNIITIPSQVRPIMEESPPFMRATTFASMDIPGPFEAVAHEAYFNVTLPDMSWDAKRIREFMSQFNYPVISSISVHEAYPGHYVQFLWMHNIDDRVRKIFGSSSNAEGWAHYCEQMMLDQGLGLDKGRHNANYLRLGMLQEAMLRDARYLVSIKLHTGKMSFEQAVDFFVKEGYQSREVAIVETKRATMDPMYLYYTLGKLEILKLRRDVEKKEGAKFNLKQFHDEFMMQGFPPIKLVRKAMLHDDSAVL